MCPLWVLPRGMPHLRGNGSGDRVSTRQDRADEGGKRRAHRYDPRRDPPLGPLHPVPGLRGGVPFWSSLREAHRGDNGPSRPDEKGGSDTSSDIGAVLETGAHPSRAAGSSCWSSEAVPAFRPSTGAENDPDCSGSCRASLQSFRTRYLLSRPRSSKPGVRSFRHEAGGEQG